MPYDAPGRADELPDELLSAWNEKIVEVSEGDPSLETRFFSIDIDALADPAIVSNISWPGDPLEPTFCAGMDNAKVQALSDWGTKGRHLLQNEYCEYAIVTRTDSGGKLRPKRVQITTELREYWMCLAIDDPERLREIASATLAREVTWAELYGGDPATMDPTERKVRFAIEVAGNGRDPALPDDVPAQPRGALNHENALFMTHPINGLDDLVFIVLFGARHFAVSTDGGFRKARLHEIFIDAGQPELACRHADPRAADGAYDAVREAKQIAFANPLGMYLRDFDLATFLSIDGDPVPASWIRWGRGDEHMRQRLEVGPGDDDDAFLDDILFSDDRGEEPLVGGHQIVAKMDVGPLIAAIDTAPATEDEFVRVAEAAQVDCAATPVCAAVLALQAEFEAANPAEPDPVPPEV